MRFGDRSLANLRDCDQRLKNIAVRALQYGVLDFSVIEGHRSIADQQRLYSEGKTQIDGVTRKGKHNEYPSQAFDLLPSPHTVNGVNVWSDQERFARLAGLIQAAASEYGYKVRWGGDWDGDGNNADSTLHDMPHFELV